MLKYFEAITNSYGIIKKVTFIYTFVIFQRYQQNFDSVSLLLSNKV